MNATATAGTLARLGVVAAIGLAAAAAPASALPVPAVSPPWYCSNTDAGQLPCTWTAGVNAYPGGGDGFSAGGTDATVRALVRDDHFDSVVIDVPITATNLSDPHVEMLGAGRGGTIDCAGARSTDVSPSSAQVLSIGRTALAANPDAEVVIRPMLTVGPACDARDYYPTEEDLGSDLSGGGDVAAFANFYSGIVLQLSDDAAQLGHSGHVILDDASELDCLYDDPDNLGYRQYLVDLVGQVSARHPSLVQMFSVDWNFADNPATDCGGPGAARPRPVVNQARRDKAFLSRVGLVGIDGNLPLNHNAADDVTSASTMFGLWQTATATIAGSAQSATAAGLVRYLQSFSGHDIVLSAIGYSDCSTNPVYDPNRAPADCNKVLPGDRQQPPSLAALEAEQAADRATDCYWTQAAGAAEPWFIGLWWWDIDFDASPNVGPYDLTWGQRPFGSSALTTLRSFQDGGGSCSAVGSLAGGA